VLDYFSGAIHLGLTATPKERRPARGATTIPDPEYNLKYFGNPIYTYSLKLYFTISKALTELEQQLYQDSAECSTPRPTPYTGTPNP
jgi:hypothetical protein